MFSVQSKERFHGIVPPGQILHFLLLQPFQSKVLFLNALHFFLLFLNVNTTTSFSFFGHISTFQLLNPKMSHSSTYLCFEFIFVLRCSFIFSAISLCFSLCVYLAKNCVVTVFPCVFMKNLIVAFACHCCGIIVCPC